MKGKERTMLRKKALLPLAAIVLTGLIVAGLDADPIHPVNPARGGRGDAARGQRDPNQMRQMRDRFRQQAADRMKESLGASDEEWKILYPRVEKVQNLVRDAQGGGMRMGRRGRMGRGRGGGTGREVQPQGEQTDLQKKSEALRTLLENEDAKPAAIKGALDGFRKAREKSRQELAIARKELRGVVTLRQEAQLVLMGLLD
jgi:hypothetical protein